MADSMMAQAELMQAALVQTDEFKALEAAYNDMKTDGAAYDLFKRFQDVQLTLQQKQMTGEAVSPEEMTNARELADQVGSKTAIQGVMAKERDLNDLLTRTSQKMMEPITELYKG